MPKIKPFRAWRYHPLLKEQIGKLVSPLYDVVSKNQLQQLYRNELNSIHLAVPNTNNPYKKAKKILKKWKNEQILIQDKKPSIYVYYQYFYLPNSSRKYCRKGFITLVKLYDWKDKVIYRHENTMPSSVNERKTLLEEVGVSVSPTHSLYSDLNFSLCTYMDEAIQVPLYKFEDYQGVKDVIACIDDQSIINIFISFLKDKKIILADGHHRYQAALDVKEKLGTLPEENAYNYHMMYFSNLESMDFHILPTHRLVRVLANMTEGEFINSVANFFYIKKIENSEDLSKAISGERWSFGLIFENKIFKITLKGEYFNQMDWNFPQIIKELDLTVVHYFIFEKILKISKNEQRKSDILIYERSFSECIKKVSNKESALAVITNEITVDTIKKVCDSGYIMPPKSTFFYPKLMSGYLFNIF